MIPPAEVPASTSSSRSPAASHSFDVVIYGGTPGGIAAAITAARLGRRVVLVEYQHHLGAMTASGLGKSDVEHKEAIGGVWIEFVERVHDHYVQRYGAQHENVRLCQEGYCYEPSVAEAVFDQMVREQPGILVLRGHRLESAARNDRRVAEIQVVDRRLGAHRLLRGAVFIDATYEGDLMAAAGAAYRLGRESRAEFGEEHAGVVYMDYETRTFLPGTTGEGDRRIPAYTYRLCVSTDPANSVVLTVPPSGYDRRCYLGYLDDLDAGRFAPPKEMREGVGYYAPTFNTIVRALSLAELPNRKFDVNMNPRPLGFPFAEENYDYPEADWGRRETISSRLRDLTLGLLWFLQNDPAIAPEQRALAQQFNLAWDEFADNGNFPWQLYVREARRLVGEYTLSERDLTRGADHPRAQIHRDSVSSGEYPIDSFPVRKHEPEHKVALEGYIMMLEDHTQPFQIPYRVMVPKQVDGLLVPVAASTTHIAFSSVRLEPTWMALGQAAATAAHLALLHDVPLRDVEISALQRELLRRGQVITFFHDLKRTHPHAAALQYFGARGLFPDYSARADEPILRPIARKWLELALGETGRQIAGNIVGEGCLSAEEFARIANRALTGASPRPTPSGEVTRGEFCALLFQIEAPGVLPVS